MVERSGDELLLELWAQEYQSDPEYIAEGLAIEVTDEALVILERKGLNQTQLAERMGVSRQNVSRIFTATPNLTLLSIARMAVALDVRPRMILDSGSYFIRSITESISFEEFQTDSAIQRSQYEGTSTLDTMVNLQGERHALA